MAARHWKHQIPSSKQISKLQFPKHERPIFELWALEFPWDLEFAIWDLSTLHAEVAELTFCHAGKSFNGVRFQDRAQLHLSPPLSRLHFVPQKSALPTAAR